MSVQCCRQNVQRRWRNEVDRITNDAGTFEFVAVVVVVVGTIDDGLFVAATLDVVHRKRRTGNRSEKRFGREVESAFESQFFADNIGLEIICEDLSVVNIKYFRSQEARLVAVPSTCYVISAVILISNNFCKISSIKERETVELYKPIFTYSIDNAQKLELSKFFFVKRFIY